MSVINGTPGNDTLAGTGASDTIQGLAGADLLQGLDGNDALDGGEGNDTAYYAGPLSDFDITFQAGIWTVTDKNAEDSGEGTDTLTNIEFLQFNDELVELVPDVIRRVSVTSDGSQGNGLSSFASISADGRYVAFPSQASNLVAGDTNGTWDVFVHDLQTGETRRASVASDGSEGNGFSGAPSLSADGRYVAFLSQASNLVAGDTNGLGDIFIHDLQTGETRRVSVATDGSQSNNTSIISLNISANGRYVAFESNASNLVAGDTNGGMDIFVHDLQTAETRRVSIASDGSEGNNNSPAFLTNNPPSLSADGRYVAFSSQASNLVAGDTNGTWDVFVHDLQTGETRRVSVASDGSQSNALSPQPRISDNGRYVAFTSVASNLVTGDTNGAVDTFVHDLQTGETRRVSIASDGSEGNLGSGAASISADGRYVAFASSSSNLVAGDTNGGIDIFVHDLQSGNTRRVSVASDDIQGNGNSNWPRISADGRYVAFESEASNLAAEDTNGALDIFVVDLGPLPEDTVIHGTAGNDSLTGGPAAEALYGYEGNDTLQGNGGADTIDGGAGRDIALFSGSRQDYTIVRSGSSLAVQDNTPERDGVDTLNAVERLRFQDSLLALDLDGNAGTVARFLGAVFGNSAIANLEYVGIGLHFIDDGLAPEALMQFAIDARLGTGASARQVVDLLYTNVVGVAPSEETAQSFIDLLNNGTYTLGSLGVMAADTSLNTDNIGLVGLMEQGLAYTEYTP